MDPSLSTPLINGNNGNNSSGQEQPKSIPIIKLILIARMTDRAFLYYNSPESKLDSQVKNCVLEF